MHRVRAFVFVCITVCALSLPAYPSDEQRGALPAGTYFALSVRSFNAVLDAFDDASVAVYKNSNKNIQPGMVKALVTLYNMVPAARFESWDKDAELFMYAVREDDTLAFVVSASSFKTFVENFTVPQTALLNKDDGPLRVFIPQLGLMWVAELSDGRVAVAATRLGLDILRNAWTEGWRPRHAVNGVLGIEFAPKPGWRLEHPSLADLEALFEIAFYLIEDQREALLDADGKPHGARDADGQTATDLEIAMGFIRSLQQLSPMLENELDGVSRIVFDLGLDEAGVTLETRVFTAPDTIMGALIAGGANLENIPHRFSGNAAEPLFIGSWQLDRALFPDFSSIAGEVGATSVEIAFPDLREEFSALCGGFADMTHLPNILSMHSTGKSRLLVLRIDGDDPARIMNTWLRGLEFSNTFSDIMVERENQAYIKYALSDETTPDGTPYKQVKISGESLEAAAKRLPNPIIAGWVKSMFANMTFMFGYVDNTFCIAGGMTDERELLPHFLAGLKNQPETRQPPVVAPAAYSSDSRQYFSGVVLFDGVLLDTADWMVAINEEFVAPPAATPARNAAMIRDFRKAQPLFRRSREYSTFSLGGGDGALKAELRVSFDSLNAIFTNIDIFKQITLRSEQEIRNRPSPDAGPGLDSKDISDLNDDGFGD